MQTLNEIDTCHCLIVSEPEQLAQDVDSTRIAIGGASAGGGLTAALALRARDERTVKPVLQLPTYPMLDDRSAFKADPDPKHRRLMGQRMNRLGWETTSGAVTQTMRFRREPRILVVCRPRGSALALLICSSMSASSMPIDSNKAACHARWKLSPGHFTDSI